MAIVRKPFHSQDVGMGTEDWLYLARDTESGRIFIYHEWSHNTHQRHEGGNEDIELSVFLGGTGVAQDRLRELLGTLVS